jgi:hypothetical protein
VTAEYSVRCSSCDGVSAVGREAVGRAVACPFCGDEFVAIPEVRAVRPLPVVPVAKRSPVRAEIDPEATLETGEGIPFLVGLALLPLGVPIVWVLLMSGGRFEPIFTATVPIALGLGATGLGIGAALTKDWSAGRKLKSVLAIALVAYVAGGALFVMKREWGEALRKRIGADEFNWQDYDAGPFAVKVPPKLRKEKDPEPLLPAWNLYAVRFGNPMQPASDCYRIAHGAEPAEFARLADAEWFESAVKQLATEETGPPVRTTPVESRGFPGIESSFQLADGATTLTVRLYRVGPAVILLAVEGPLLPADAKDVQTFFRKLYIKAR